MKHFQLSNLTFGVERPNKRRIRLFWIVNNGESQGISWRQCWAIAKGRKAMHGDPSVIIPESKEGEEKIKMLRDLGRVVLYVLLEVADILTSITFNSIRLKIFSVN
ncbi:unnamed protein product [Orchesella dallaii]|uniref:Uncharacterized protein n=1 Tax=Orchesella dallaii TaxID=48710 RepID=A0ABP1SAZ1_9HEXA